MPKVSRKIRTFLNLDEPIWSYIENKDGSANNIEVLLEKIDRKNVDMELNRLKNKSK